MNISEMAIIRKNIIFLIQNIDINSIKYYLHAKFILTPTDMEEISLPCYTETRRKEILLWEILPKRGENAYKEFVKALEQDDHFSHVVKRLQNTKPSEEELEKIQHEMNEQSISQGMASSSIPGRGLGEAEHLLTKEQMLGPWDCILLLKTINDNQELDLYGKKILSVLQKDRKSILENDPNILIVLIKKADKLIGSEYYEEIIKVAPHGSNESPLKYLLQLMKNEYTLNKLLKNQNKLMSVIKIISSYGDVQYRTECLDYISFIREFSSGNLAVDYRPYRFEWSEEYLSTVKHLLDKGADPTWIDPEDLERERKKRSTAQTEFFWNIFVNLWEKNELYESILQVLPLMLSKKCTYNELLRGTLLHGFVSAQWSYIATNRKFMPPDFFLQFKNILREILRHDGTLLVQKDCGGRTPLQYFLEGIRLEESIFGDVREIIQLLQSPVVLSSQDDQGLNALHYLARYFPVIQGEVTQRGRESLLELVKSFASQSDVGCQDKDDRTALHYLAEKFPNGISEQSREVYQDFVKHLANYNILEKRSSRGFAAIHYLVDNFTFWFVDWPMETLVEIVKCLAVRSNISLKNLEGDTALEMISKKYGNIALEHYKGKFKELTDILSENN